MFFLNNIKSNNKCALISDNQKITYKELINLSSNILTVGGVAEPKFMVELGTSNFIAFTIASTQS